MRRIVARKAPFVPESAAVLFGFDLFHFLIQDFTGSTWYGSVVLIALGAALVGALESSRIHAGWQSSLAKAVAAALALAMPGAILGPLLAGILLVWWLLAGGRAAESMEYR